MLQPERLLLFLLLPAVLPLSAQSPDAAIYHRRERARHRHAVAWHHGLGLPSVRCIENSRDIVIP